jgi:16S rRNA G527 N7-methylase RsmG
MVLLEPRRKATSFLREVARAVPLPQVRALELRADEAARDPVVSGRASIVVARALRLDVFLVAAAPLLSASGEAVAMQTPRTARVAGEGTAGLRLARRRDYTLPDGARRTLLVFRRTNLPVSSTHPLC